VFKLKI